MTPPIISVSGLHKKFCRSLKHSMLYGTKDMLRHALGRTSDVGTLRTGEFWALENVSFDIRPGETLGIMGMNGSGKSTLLRILAGIFPPDRGRVEVHGRVSPLIAVGAGFHPHMTGRENIFLNGVILGMTKQEIRKAYDAIIDFADIGDFIDSPVSTYSSGMFVRLGFAIAIHSAPDILIADEVLSVGDYLFQMKCFKKIQDLLKNGCTIVLVSHSDIAIRSACERVLLLDRGHMVGIGPTDQMLVTYRSEIMRRHIGTIVPATSSDTAFTNKLGTSTLGKAVISSIEIADQSQELIRRDHQEFNKIPYRRHNTITATLTITVQERLIRPRIGFYLRDMSKSELTYVCAATVSGSTDPQLERLDPGTYQFTFTLDLGGLTPNVYTIITGIGDEQNHVMLYDCIDETDVLTLEITGSAELIETDVLINKPYFVTPYTFTKKEVRS